VAWSYRLATFRGIPLKVHITFLLIVFVIAANWSGQGVAGVMFGAGLALLLFACVALHEFGHALAAQRFGIPVREIVLLPIGGVALLGRQARHPVQELVIAAAGPAVNVVIMATLLPLLWMVGETRPVGAMLFLSQGDTGLSVSDALRWLFVANLNLVLFNLIPAFPLDGGRILRGLLGLRMDWGRATRWATTTGQTLAVAMGVWALLSGQMMLMFVAILVFVAAGATEADERARTVLATQRVGDACNRHAIVLAETDQLSAVVRHLLTSYQPDFAVVQGRQLKGVVLRRDVLVALASHGRDVPVSSVMSTCPRVDADASLAEVRATLEEEGAVIAAVYDRHEYVGLVGLDDIREAEVVLAFIDRSSTLAPSTLAAPLARQVTVGRV